MTLKQVELYLEAISKANTPSEDKTTTDNVGFASDGTM